MKQTLLFVFAISSLFSTAQQNITSSFVYQDSTREFMTYIPQAYLDNSSEAVPLLLNLHGYGSVNWQQELYGDFRPIADAENFIICHPNGTVDALGSRFWNSGIGSTIDDIGFISALIDSLEILYNIDSEKVFSTGMSNGGFMSLTLACELPNKVKAVASVTGSMTAFQINNCNNTNPTPMMQIHGTNDQTVIFEGSENVEGIENVVGFWVNQNGCDSVAVQTNIPDNNAGDNSTATRYDFNQNCGDDASVVFYKVENGGHTWPGASFLIPGEVTNLDFDASAVIWEFFCPESTFNSINPVTNK
ncbi:MAG: polyhydroxybutyrate depolymerase, partial [Flavobacteriales bacterium]